MLLDLAERAVGRHALGVSRKLADRLHIGGEPRKPVGSALLAVEQPGHRMALDKHPLAHARDGVGQQGVDGGGGLADEVDQFVSGGGAGSGDRHGAP